MDIELLSTLTIDFAIFLSAVTGICNQLNVSLY